MLRSLQAFLQIFISSDETGRKPPESFDNLPTQSAGHLKIANIKKLPQKQY